MEIISIPVVRFESRDALTATKMQGTGTEIHKHNVVAVGTL